MINGESTAPQFESFVVRAVVFEIVHLFVADNQNEFFKVYIPVLTQIILFYTFTNFRKRHLVPQFMKRENKVLIAYLSSVCSVKKREGSFQFGFH